MKRRVSCFLLVFCFLMILGNTFVTTPVKAEIPSGTTDKELPAISSGDPIIQNGGFEDMESAVKPRHWAAKAFTTSGGKGASVISGEKAYSGNSVMLRGGSGIASYPFVQQYFAVEGKAKYQISLWVRKDGGSAAVTAKLEFWASGPTGNVCVQEGNTFNVTSTNGWQRILYNFVAPFTAQSVSIMPRLHSGDENECAYFDNVEVYMVEPPAMMEVKTDSIFYYPEETEGEATASVRLDSFPEAADGTVLFSLLDGENVLSKQAVLLNTDGKAKFRFDTVLLKELKKKYSIRAVLQSTDKETLFCTEEPVYKFERPKFFGKDGIFRTANGILHPVIAYHVGQSQYDECVAAGINVVQGSTDDLAVAERYGLKVLVTLYGKMLPAGNAANAAQTKEIVAKYKDDERIFGWAVMDEPFLNMADPLPDLRESYRIIREIDDNHPVYICEATPAYFADTVKNCDVFSIDPYLPQPSQTNPKMHTTHVLEYTQKARQASNGKKPVLSVLQAFKWYNYMPDKNAERHMIYQALMAGAAGHGYYEIGNANTEDGKSVPLYNVKETDIWEGIVSFGENEQADVYKHFVKKAYPGFSHMVNAESMYHGYIKNGKLYFIVMNQDIASTKTITVLLTSFDGNVTIDGFSARTVIGGGDLKKVTSSSFSVGLAPYETAIIEVTAANEDFAWLMSGMVQKSFWKYFDEANGITILSEPVHFTDMQAYPWALDAAEVLFEAGIIETAGAFQPDEAVSTRDFAEYLVKGLQLSENPLAYFGKTEDVPLERIKLAELVAKAIRQKRISIGENLEPLPTGMLTEEELAKEPFVLKTAEKLHLAFVKKGGSATNVVSRAEAVYCLSYLMEVVACGFDDEMLFADHYSTLMDGETRGTYLSALLEKNENTGDKTQEESFSENGRNFVLYVNGKNERVEKTAEKNSKAASLLSVTDAAEATFNGSRLHVLLPPDGIVFAEFDTIQKAGAYVDALRHCILPRNCYLKGDDLPIAAAYVKEDGQWRFLRLYLKGEQFSATDEREYMIKCFRWSNWLVTDKKTVVVRTK